ncbi:histidine kinase [Janthinobacterium sp. PAMC25594]|uniref:histidine kinase n=1 Tax=Janthinobacterium sp. PAMC25594 TaxID=2861284 RepID=UPI001C62521F|nr:sensor histidine kinase [Janthinobacterium sp. PAMC25594]QYG08786.1 histidine kinase [Janthinobacterium sp. PAMC25594]
MSSLFRYLLRYCLACCLALPCFAMGMDRLSLDEGWRACGASAAAPAAPLHQLLRPGQLLCVERAVTLAATPPSTQLLVLSALASSELWLDGHLIGSNGQPARQASGERAGDIDFAIHLTPQQLTVGKHHLRLLLSTQQAPARLASPLYALYLIDRQDHRAALAWYRLPPLLLAGALGAVALLFLALTVLYQRQRHWAMFAALCLVATLLLVVELWRSVTGYAYPWHLPRLYAVSALTWLFSTLLPLYFYTAYRLPRWPLAAAVLLACIALAGALPAHFDTRCWLMFLTGLAASLLLNLGALWRRLPGSRGGTLIALASCALFLLTGSQFAEGGFALVVCFLLLPLCAQLLAQLLSERGKAARARQLENQLLRKSMQPHFLMNSLSLIGELNAQSPQAAETFVEALGAELRMLNEFAQQPSIALTQELALCQNYLSIMSTRLQQPCRLQLDGEAAGVTVPPAILLTALENAFSHNRYRHGALFVLRSARLAQTQVLTLVLPEGEARAHAGGGVGEQYIRASLHAVFGDAAHYASEQHQAGWRLTFTLPAAP